ncbi:MAG: hypothetical protein V9G08_07580 [Dermatophilaceae bacterium]
MSVSVERGPSSAAPLVACDEVAWVDEGTAVATKHIVPTDPYLQGHYPDFTIYPGVFTIETVFQGATALLPQSPPLEIRSIESVRFQAPLLPGDTSTATLRMRPAAGGATRIVATCERADGSACAEVRLTVGPREAYRPPGVLSHGELKSLLPHRNPMLHVDRVDELLPGERIVAVKAVSGSEACYQGLSSAIAPEGYRYPVPLIVEGLGQAGGVLWLNSLTRDDVAGKKLIFGSARGLEVLGAAYPGDVLRHVVQASALRKESAIMTGEVWVEDRLIIRVQTILALLRAEDSLAL